MKKTWPYIKKTWPYTQKTWPYIEKTWPLEKTLKKSWGTAQPYSSRKSYISGMFINFSMSSQ